MLAADNGAHQCRAAQSLITRSSVTMTALFFCPRHAALPKLCLTCSRLPVCHAPFAGLVQALSLLPDPQSWPGGSLLAPGGAKLQRELAEACLRLALGLTGLDAAGGFAGGGSSKGMRQPPQIVEAADGENTIQ